jgi:threonine aldolase
MSVPARYDFASDNTAGICPEAANALLEANCQAEISYASDRWTHRLQATGLRSLRNRLRILSRLQRHRR